MRFSSCSLTILIESRLKGRIWSGDGTLDGVLNALQLARIDDGAIIVDSGVSMGVSSEPIDVLRVVGERDPDKPTDHALVHSRSGYSTKVHLLVDRMGIPLAFNFTGEQAHETTALLDVLDKADEELHESEGNPVAWPLNLSVVKGYRAYWTNKTFFDCGINPVISSKFYEDRDARTAQYDRDCYPRGNIVEYSIGWCRECKRVFSRFDKTTINYEAMIKMALIERFLVLI